MIKKKRGGIRPARTEQFLVIFSRGFETFRHKVIIINFFFKILEIITDLWVIKSLETSSN